jgi:hypothetical protein
LIGIIADNSLMRHAFVTFNVQVSAGRENLMADTCNARAGLTQIFELAEKFSAPTSAEPARAGLPREIAGVI